ncbi:MAG: cobalamin biosynthesis protein CbiD [Bacteroidaceae bacterium]|nr:cobalamin biosynthesis protein CbiD [Bacteroidaceae bacterium]
MILVFGGTTEGRKATEVLEEAGKTYYYSTKTGEQELTLHHGVRIDGAMDGEAMMSFVRKHEIRLIVDAAHPFAAKLHETIAEVAESLHIPIIRYERIYPPRDPDITWIDDYSQVPTDIHTLLATTGVQSISRLKWLEAKGVKVIYRILKRKSSISEAAKQQTHPLPLPVSEGSIMSIPPLTDKEYIWVSSDGNHSHPLQGGAGGGSAILLKESGISGGFVEKVTVARERGMRIIVLKRTPLFSPPRGEDTKQQESPAFGGVRGGFSIVNGPHVLRRMVEQLLPDFFPMKTGLTTGACATAAVKAALLSLMGEEADEIRFALPDGETLSIPVEVERPGVASVVKDYSDDPDVTRGCKITAEVQLTDTTEIRFMQGKGVGIVTLPGLGLPVGEPAINPTPRRMIEQTIRELTNQGCDVTISVENGEEIAQKTFNARVGVLGGISIIGTSGIVSPLSNEAFIESIRREMEVAKAIGCTEIGLVSGKTSEDALMKERDIRCIHYGNFIGEALKIASSLEFRQVTIAIMIGKAVKLAEGHLDTHSHKVTMNREFLKQIAGSDTNRIDRITLARELWDIMPPAFFEKIQNLCYKHCRKVFPEGELTIKIIKN